MYLEYNSELCWSSKLALVAFSQSSMALPVWAVVRFSTTKLDISAWVSLVFIKTAAGYHPDLSAIIAPSGRACPASHCCG